MTREEAVDILEHFLDSFYEFPDWHVLSEKDTEAIETLIKSVKEDKKWLAIIARHFATWQKERDQFQIDMAHDGGYMEGQDYAREQMEKDEKWLQDNHKKIFNNGWDEGFGDGRDSMEEDMMKDVVEIPLHQWLPALLYDKMSEKGFKDGDMVKLIIVKEE